MLRDVGRGRCREWAWSRVNFPPLTARAVLLLIKDVPRGSRQGTQSLAGAHKPGGAVKPSLTSTPAPAAAWPQPLCASGRAGWGQAAEGGPDVPFSHSLEHSLPPAACKTPCD